MAFTDKARREHHWDAIRAFLMILGIPYHVALAYRVGKPWILNSASDGAPVFAWIAEAIHVFRMPAFFVVAGYFAAMLLERRDPRLWLRGRLRRLGIPFLVSIVTLIPVMNMAAELSNFPLHGAIRSWIHESTTSGGYWVRHLWFIITLLQCSAAAALLCHFRPGMRSARLAAGHDAKLARRLPLVIGGVATITGLWEALAIEGFYMAGLATNIPQQILRLDDLISYAPYFAIGTLVQRAPAVSDRLSVPSVPMMMIALAAMVADIALAGAVHPMVARIFSAVAAVTVTQTLIALSKRFFSDGANPLIGRIVPASFVIYLFHLPIAMILVVLAQAWPVSAYVKVPAIITLTMALSWAVWVAVSRSPLLRLLFDGVRRPSRHSQPVGRLASAS